jgi:glycosyltransferase involved in cell wall biosynthesis
MTKQCPRSGKRTYRLAVLTSHPIQYRAPLFRALAAQPEIDLHVFFCYPWGAERYYDPGFGVSVAWDVPLLRGYRYTFLRNLISPNPSYFFGVINPGIIGAILRGHFDALWIDGWALATNWLAWATASVARIPILMRGESNGLTEPEGLKRKLKRAVLKTFFDRVAGFLAIGTNNANFYKSYGVPEGRIFWTPYAVDNAFFIEQAQRLAGQKHSLREKEHIPPDLPVILFCGKFIEKKRPFDLLRAFAHLDGYHKASLVFVGDGPLRAEMTRFVAEHRLSHVYFLYFRNQNELPACYAMADVLILPSTFEPWGLVLNEAMCFGLPVIASDQVGAAADLVQQGVNGFTYPVGDVEALANCLRRVLADEGARQEMGRQSRAVISRLGIEEDVKGMVGCLNRIIA